MTGDLGGRIGRLVGSEVRSLRPLHGGCIAEVARVDLADGRALVAKRSRGLDLTLEAFMLGELRRLSPLPVPDVLASEPDLLLLAYVEHDPAGLDDAAQRHAAELLAATHAVRGPAFGYERDTLIGPLPQPNPWTGRWLPFFRDQRLLLTAERARRAGHLPSQTARRLETLAGRLERWLDEPAAPALLHGDLWSGNILARRGRIVATLDPAIYYGHPEVELAFTTLFGTFGEPFFDAYTAIAATEPGFHELRRDLYNLYPLLVHVTLFGAGYLAAGRARPRPAGLLTLCRCRQPEGKRP